MADVPAVIETAAAVVVALGSGGAIVGGLSGWLGRVWAERMMGKERAKHDRELAKLRADLEKQNADTLEQLRAKNAENLEHLSAALDLHKGKLAGAHADKLAIYRSVIDLLVDIIMVREILKAGFQPVEPSRDLEMWRRFETARLKAHGHLAIFAPQSVLDAYSELSDYFLQVAEGTLQYEFGRARELGFVFLNCVRIDLGIDPSPVEYRGRR